MILQELAEEGGQGGVGGSRGLEQWDGGWWVMCGGGSSARSCGRVVWDVGWWWPRCKRRYAAVLLGMRASCWTWGLQPARTLDSSSVAQFEPLLPLRRNSWHGWDADSFGGVLNFFYYSTKVKNSPLSRSYYLRCLQQRRSLTTW